MEQARLVLVTGATGYIGGRLVPKLLKAGYRVRCLVRDAWRLQGRPWKRSSRGNRGGCDVAGDPAACVDRRVGGLLLHPQPERHADYRERDMAVARGFSQAAKAVGVERIIYLGGLGDPAADLSTHLRSRQETGAALSEGGVPVTEFRVAIIVGAGSLSFEMIRHLTERLPVMVCPRWVFTRIQPIAIGDDVLSYLVAALKTRGKRRPGDRDRRRRCGQLRRHDERLCQGPRPAVLADPRAGAHAAPVGPLGQLDDAGERGNRLSARSRGCATKWWCAMTQPNVYFPILSQWGTMPLCIRRWPAWRWAR